MLIKTDTQVKSAPAGVHRVRGATGLYLKKGAAGAGSWFWRYRKGDRRSSMGLGSISAVSLADAR
jgi:hypothetical protein